MSRRWAMILSILLCSSAMAQEPPDGDSESRPSSQGKENSSSSVGQNVLRIISARYGNPNDPSACMVTESVRPLCDNRTHCTIPVQDSLCHLTEKPGGLIQSLSVSYICSAGHKGTLHRTADKPSALILHCPLLTLEPKASK